MSAAAERRDESKTVTMLRERLANAKELGHEYVLLVAGRRGGNSPRNWTRCRVINGKPSLMGRCIGPGTIMGTWLFEVKTAQLEAWLYFKGVRDV